MELICYIHLLKFKLHATTSKFLALVEEKIFSDLI